MSKKNDISAERVVIDAVDVEPLLRNERWSASGGENEPLTSGADGQNNACARGENSVVEELCLRPQIIGKDIDIERLVRLTSEDIIDKFLSTEHHRIVAEEGEPESEIVVQAEFDDEDDFVSEELAEVYLAQGLKDMAKETYRKLSLVNPEKSIYFAGLIEKIDSNN
jgi:uncharacterized protein (DUF2164 family)